MLRQADQPKIVPIAPNPFVPALASAPPRLPAPRELTAMDPRIQRALEIVARELDKPQLVKSLATRLRLSPSRFEHLFKKETGQAFKTFLQAARMKRAKEMLQDLRLRIKEVGAAVGYADVSNFAHYFRKQYGRPPSQSRSPFP